MGIKYRMDRKGNLIVNLWQGEVTAEEWLAHLQAMTAEPDWPEITRMLCDLRLVTDISTIGDPEIGRAVEILRAAPGDLRAKKCAIPASTAFQVATAYQQAISPFEPSVVVFTSFETACVYLGAEPGGVREIIDQLRRETG